MENRTEKAVGCDGVLEKKKLGEGRRSRFWPSRLESTEGDRGGNVCGNIERKLGEGK